MALSSAGGLTGLSILKQEVQAGGHMGSAIDHADIRGLKPHISVLPEPASHSARAYEVA